MPRDDSFSDLDLIRLYENNLNDVEQLAVRAYFARPGETAEFQLSTSDLKVIYDLWNVAVYRGQVNRLDFAVFVLRQLEREMLIVQDFVDEGLGLVGPFTLDDLTAAQSHLLHILDVTGSWIEGLPDWLRPEARRMLEQPMNFVRLLSQLLNPITLTMGLTRDIGATWRNLGLLKLHTNSLANKFLGLTMSSDSPQWRGNLLDELLDRGALTETEVRRLFPDDDR